MRTDGMFHKTDDEVYRHDWKGGYRLEKVTELPGTLRVPVTTRTEYQRGDLPQAGVVVGERGSGMSTFIAWLTQKGGAPTWELHDVRGARKFLEAWQAAANKHACFLVVERPPGAHGDEDDVAWIAGLIESAPWKASRSSLLCVTRDVRALRTDLLFSTLLSRGHVFRLPHFDPPELEGWVRAMLGAKAAEIPTEQIEELGRSAKRWVGGQPFLTQLFFSKLQIELERAPSRDLTALFDETGDFLRDSRPHLVIRWQEQLAGLIEEPSARQLLIAYTAGQTKTPDESSFTDHDVDFFLAGWVGKTADKKWGIRSQCHEHWARQAIRKAPRSP